MGDNGLASLLPGVAFAVIVFAALSTGIAVALRSYRRIAEDRVDLPGMVRRNRMNARRAEAADLANRSKLWAVEQVEKRALSVAKGHRGNNGALRVSDEAMVSEAAELARAWAAADRVRAETLAALDAEEAAEAERDDRARAAALRVDRAMLAAALGLCALLLALALAAALG